MPVFALLGIAALVAIVVAVLRYFPTNERVSHPAIPGEEHSRQTKEEEPPSELSNPEITLTTGSSIPPASTHDSRQDEIAQRRKLIAERIRESIAKIKRGECTDTNRAILAEASKALVVLNRECLVLLGNGSPDEALMSAPTDIQQSLFSSSVQTGDLYEDEDVRILERTLEVALARAIPVLTPVELIALLRLPESPSLEDLLQDEAEIDEPKKAIHKRKFGLEFPKKASGNLKSVDVTMRVIAPDFEPPQIEKIVRVQPDSDCEEQVFLLTPKLVGTLVIQFDVLLGSVTLASRALKTKSEPSDRLVSASRPAVVSLSVKVDATPALEIAHVLFIDIVGYSKLAIDHQQKVLWQLQEAVLACAEFKRAFDSLVPLPTGDGVALVFFNDALAPVRCAVELSKALRNESELNLRMGIHSGPVYRIDDINKSKNVAGSSINMAQRVMDCGDAGHILVSKPVAEILFQLTGWGDSLTELGEAEVKHGVRIHLFNLCTAEVGNPKVPQKLALKAKTLTSNGLTTTGERPS
jgi:class 3 adenylate cyclase